MKAITLDIPRVTLEELDGDDLVVRIAATPATPSDGPRLASELLAAVTSRLDDRSEEVPADEYRDLAPHGP